MQVEVGAINLPEMSGTHTIPELTLDEAWNLLSEEPDAVLIDVRTSAEWSFVGVPHLVELHKAPRFVEWNRFPGGNANPDFLAQASQGLAPGQPILLLCRSGARSLAAAKALGKIGFANTYNIADGFEGELDENDHRHGGWKEHLPWRQS